MTERGLPIVDGAPACPFVAFDDDRDERATSPDHRHRCYAENPPAPRALAHQEAYCLSSAFPVCPIFQDWARREAAQARVGRPGSGDDLDDLPPIAPDPPPRRSGRQVWSAPPPWLRPGSGGSPGSADAQAGSEAGEASRSAEAARGAAAASGAAASGAAASGAAASGAAASGAAAGGLAGSYADRMLSNDGPAAGRPPSGPPPPGPPPADEDWQEEERWPEPPLAGGGRDRAVPSSYRDDGEPAMEDMPPRRRGHERVDAGRDDPRHDEYAPAWERPRRLEAYPTLRSRRFPGAIVPPLLLGIVAILLVAAALFFLPSLLGLGGGGGGSASPSPSLGASVGPVVSSGPTEVPAATPFTYVAQAGDTMSRIAKKFGVPLSDLIAANADTIPNPDKLQIGDTVIIPTPAPSELPGASQP